MTRKHSRKLPPAIILAGGLGTRLRSAFASGPKSMGPVAGRPFLDYILRWLRIEGVDDVVLCVGYKRSAIQRYVGKGRKWGLHVVYSIERALLGTGGAVKKAEQLISGDSVIVINGDTLVEVSLKDLVSFHRQRRAWATLATVRMNDHQRYGSLKLDRAGRITGFIEKNTIKSRGNSPRFINAGVYVFHNMVLNTIRPRRPISLEKEVFPKLAANRRIYGFVTTASFIDIGVPEDFQRAQVEFRERFRHSDSN